MIVLDTSAAIPWFFDDERDEFAKETAKRVVEEHAIVPSIFPGEFANVLLSAARSKRIRHADIPMILQQVKQLPLQIELATFDVEEELDLAERHKLSLYDALYLRLARERRLTLVTRDASLVAAARREKISVEFPAA